MYIFSCSSVMFRNHIIWCKMWLQHWIISNSITAFLPRIEAVVNTTWVHFVQQSDRRVQLRLVHFHGCCSYDVDLKLIPGKSQHLISGLTRMLQIGGFVIVNSTLLQWDNNFQSILIMSSTAVTGLVGCSCSAEPLNRMSISIWQDI